MKKVATPEIQLLHLSHPVFAWLEITYACPGTCPGCPSSSAVDRPPELSAVEWEEILKGLSPYLAEARLTGGEPTLFPDLPLILEALEEEKLIERFDRFPARYRLKPVGSKLRRSIMK